jgi:hypothetical protein
VKHIINCNKKGGMEMNKATGKKILQGTSLEWRVNTGSLLSEIISGYPGKGGGIFVAPLNIFKNILVQVGERASELNDPVLNALMCRLAIYAESDPYSDGYNYQLLTDTLDNEKYQKWLTRKRKNGKSETTSITRHIPA